MPHVVVAEEAAARHRSLVGQPRDSPELQPMLNVAIVVTFRYCVVPELVEDPCGGGGGS